MNYIWLFLAWLFGILFLFLLISMLLTQNWSQALILALLVFLSLPPVTTFTKTQLNWNIHPGIRIVLMIGLMALLGNIMINTKHNSIYKSPEVKTRFIEIYDEKMLDWQVPYEDIYVDTRYGKVHVIASGAEDSPPLILLHASIVSSWSWKYNAAELSQHYRIYAIDLIGDPGKSEYDSLENIIESKKDQADLYAEICDRLGIEKTYIIGASEGGFIASNFARYYPERIEKLVLMGPMGYSGAFQSIIRITISQMLPLKPIQESTFRWAFSDNEKLREDYAEWFPMAMTGFYSVKIAPMPFSAEERQSLQVPVMFIFGNRDNLVGDPLTAEKNVQDIPDVRVEIVDAGHLMAGELPQTCNQLILDFFEDCR